MNEKIKQATIALLKGGCNTCNWQFACGGDSFICDQWNAKSYVSKTTFSDLQAEDQNRRLYEKATK